MSGDQSYMGKVFVTGGTGFIGRHLVDRLVDRGEHVTCLIRNPKKKQDFVHLPVDFFQGDLTKPETLTGLSGRFDTVFHLAGELRSTNKQDYDNMNAGGVRNLYEVLAATDHKPRSVLHVSSIGAPGPSDVPEPKAENSPARPVSIYGTTKLAGELMARNYMNRLPITILRPSIVYGPGDRNSIPIYKMVKKGLVFIPPMQPKYLSMLYVHDFVEVMIQMAETEAGIGEIVNVAGEEAISYYHIIDLIAEALGTKPRKIEVGALPFYFLAAFWTLKSILLKTSSEIVTFQKLPELFAQYWISNTQKLHSILTKVPNTPLREGVLETTRWYRKHSWL